eukprot:COSAG02_NODE_10896_length_1836_cov_2.047784_1_plen_448_part_00
MDVLWLPGSLTAAFAVATLVYVAALPDEQLEVRPTPALVPCGLATLSWLGVSRVLLGAPAISVLDAAVAVTAMWSAVRRLVKGLFALSCIALCLVAILYSYNSCQRSKEGAAGRARNGSHTKSEMTVERRPALSAPTIRLSPGGSRLRAEQLRNTVVSSSSSSSSSSMGQDTIPVAHAVRGRTRAWGAPKAGAPARSQLQRESTPARRLYSARTSKVIFRSVPKHQLGANQHDTQCRNPVPESAPIATPEPEPETELEPEPEPELRLHSDPGLLQLIPVESSTSQRQSGQPQLDFSPASRRSIFSPQGSSSVNSEADVAAVDGVAHVSHTRHAADRSQSPPSDRLADMEVRTRSPQVLKGRDAAAQMERARQTVASWQERQERQHRWRRQQPRQQHRRRGLEHGHGAVLEDKQEEAELQQRSEHLKFVRHKKSVLEGVPPTSSSMYL